MKTSFFLLSAAALLAVASLAACKPGSDAPAGGSPSADTVQPALIPAPATLQRAEGAFTVDAGTRLHADGEAAQRVAKLFNHFLAAAKRPQLDTADGGAGGIRFEISGNAANAEAYTLDVKPDGIVVRAGTERGLFHGATTLWQLLTQGESDVVTLPALHIEDAPRFAWRGYMLDSARHFQSVDEIKRMLDAMALHKLNVFHWHLSDDQGWRIPIDKYPKLIEVGSCRIPAGDAGIDPATGQPAPYCGFYTKQQIRDVVAYAAARHIEVVPEIDVPGHATAAIAAYPELGLLDKAPAVGNEWGVYPNLFNTEESTFEFLEDVLAEVVELFPGRYVHIGGDEAVKDQWIASSRVQQRMKEFGAKDEMAMQGVLVARLEKFLAAHGKRLIGWDEILEAELPPAATVMSWRGIEGGIEAANKGHDVVMVPSSVLYLDYLQTDSRNEPPGRPTLSELQEVYDFEPVPPVLPADKRKHILGLQANLWTEHTRDFARVQHNTFPRLAAVAETGWTPADRKNYRDFVGRLPAMLKRYRALGIDYAQTPFEVDYRVDADRKAGTGTVALSTRVGLGEIRYTRDGSEPTPASPAYTAPLQVTLPVKLRAAAFVDGVALANATLLDLSPQALLTRNDDELDVCPDTGRLLLRLEDDGPFAGERALYNVTIFYPCWLWKNADLDGIAGLKVRLGRMPYYFQLAHDEPSRTFLPAETAHGELLVQAGGCKGKTVARLPLPAQTGADGFVELETALPEGTASGDLCFTATGDTRPRMWALDRVILLPR